MPRIRSIHPGQWTDEDFVSCSMPAQLLAIGLRNFADDAGVFEWKPITLRMQIFPARTVDIPKLLRELEGANIIRQFEAAGKPYGAIRNFRKWQRPEKPKLIHPLPAELRAYVGLGGDDPSIYGPPQGDQPDSDRGTLGDQSTTCRRPVADQSVNLSAEEGGNSIYISPLRSDDAATDQSGATRPKAAAPETRAATETTAVPKANGASPEFAEFWERYPRKVAKAAAVKAWGMATRDTAPATIMGGLAKTRWPDLQFVPHPATWLNGRRWEDEPPPAQQAMFVRGAI
jgi:hypothetical protein